MCFILLYIHPLKTGGYSKYLFYFLLYLNMSMNCSPTNSPEGGALDALYREVGLVENIGVEPMTSCVQGRRSSQLS